MRDDGGEEEEFTLPNLIPSKTIDPKEETLNFKILSLNAQSINNKFQEMRDLINNTKCSVVAVQETWGRNPTTDYSVKGFHRPEFVTRHGEGMNLGGGIAMWIREDLDYDNITIRTLEKTCEMQAVSLPDHKLCIINCYRPFGDIPLFFRNS